MIWSIIAFHIKMKCLSLGVESLSTFSFVNAYSLHFNPMFPVAYSFTPGTHDISFVELINLFSEESPKVTRI